MSTAFEEQTGKADKQKRTHTKKKKKKKKIGKLERMRGGEAKVGCARAAAYQHPTNLPRHIPDTFEALFAF
jgi:hypothetical protein